MSETSTNLAPSPQRRRLRFSLRSLFVLTTLVCSALAVVVYIREQGRQQREAVKAIKKLGGMVQYESDELNWVLSRFLGDGTVGKVVGINFNDPSVQFAEGDLAALAAFPDLHVLSFHGVNVPSSELAQIPRCRQLAFLCFEKNFSDDDVAQLAKLESFPRLIHLGLENTQITDAGLAYVGKMKQVGGLNLSGTKITDDGLVHLAELENLSWLELNRTGITGTGLVALEGLPHLRFLYVSEADITDEGLADIGRLRHLGQVAFEGDQMTDEGLLQLKDVKSLVSIGLRGKQITEPGVKRLKELLPLLHDNPANIAARVRRDARSNE